MHRCEQQLVLAGAISETEVIVQFLVLLAAGLGTAFALDKWVGHEMPTLFYLAVFGSFISYIYSAPPLKLKQSGWAGNFALGSSYISLPWWAGQVCTNSRPSTHLPRCSILCYGHALLSLYGHHAPFTDRSSCCGMSALYEDWTVRDCSSSLPMLLHTLLL